MDVFQRQKGEKFSGNAIAVELRRVLGNCPLCYRAGFVGHFFVQFGALRAIPEGKNRLNEFFEAFNHEDWGALREFQEFDVMCDDVVAYALKCPEGVAGIVVVRDRFEFLESDSLMCWKRVADKDREACLSMVPLAAWKPLW